MYVYFYLQTEAAGITLIIDQENYILLGEV